MTQIDQLQPVSIAARLRQRWPQIEQLLAKGVRHMDIVEALQAEGLPLTLKTFRAYLYRQRKRQPVAVKQIAAFGSAALPPDTGGATPPQDLPASMSVRERRKAHAEQYINPVQSHPLLQRLQRKQEE
ncbi:hypothetical protein I2492_01220 [Budviciaceae bacterium CWB-B4]|uniref:Uncharacterized protein n=1 Tax=Limnobaculum xujianqingii TaxID=2738837 RepID=A0A9D7AF78_9GAMM|nr:hypothetical protein [Limnobaculum xujianqingii]MBK5071635.1 hypothetical protein [Limnobaculum xujianqingii]MBK5174944.1 hypothetical protein [Limnobaculum xujianqingii]